MQFYKLCFIRKYILQFIFTIFCYRPSDKLSSFILCHAMVKSPKELDVIPVGLSCKSFIDYKHIYSPNVEMSQKRVIISTIQDIIVLFCKKVTYTDDFGILEVGTNFSVKLVETKARNIAKRIEVKDM